MELFHVYCLLLSFPLHVHSLRGDFLGWVKKFCEFNEYKAIFIVDSTFPTQDGRLRPASCVVGLEACRCLCYVPCMDGRSTWEVFMIRGSMAGVPVGTRIKVCIRFEGRSD